MPKISIIVPVYNREKLIKRCLDSLLNQTLKDIEIICVNDSSTDNSEKIIKQYTDSRIKLITIPHSGPSVCRNKGMEIASGEYIGFTDSDDWVDLDFFEKLYLNAKKYNADMAAAGIIRLNSLHQKYHLKFKETTVTNKLEQKLDLCDFPDKSYIWNKIYKAEELKKFNLKFEPNRLFEDVIFTPQVLYYLKTLVTVPDTFYYYWRTRNSIVTGKDAKTKNDYNYAMEFIEQFFKEHSIDPSLYVPVISKYKFFGITFIKLKTTSKYKLFRLFNFIKWKRLSKQNPAL